MYSSMTPRRILATCGVCVWTTIPSSHGVVHEAGVPGRPSTSTTHMRHEPKASRLSVAQSFGTAMPASAAARMTDVPDGTVTLMPSIETVTASVERLAGVP